MKHLLSLSIYLLLSALLAACSGRSGGGAGTPSGDTIPMRHARNIVLERMPEGYVRATLANPWKEGAPLATYLLIDRDSTLPASMPEGTVVRTPLRRAVAGTGMHAALAKELGSLSSLAGICEPEHILDPDVKRLYAAGKLTDCGSGMAPTMERVIKLHPDALLLSPFQSSSFAKIEKMGVPVIQVADYMEAGPLERAEWIRFYGLLFGQSARADSIFRAVEAEYDRLSSLAAGSKGKSVIMNAPYSGTWYMPGGRSPVGRALADAGAVYPWSTDNSTGSLPLSLEQVIAKGSGAECWLFQYSAPTPMTLRQLLSQESRYKALRAVRDGNVWGCNAEATLFHEQTPFHPERLLRDYILILHPGLLEGETVYFRKLQP